MRKQADIEDRKTMRRLTSDHGFCRLGRLILGGEGGGGNHLGSNVLQRRQLLQLLLLALL